MSDQAKRAFGSSAKPGRKDVSLDLSTARQMLPLVRIIARDLLDSYSKLDKLHPEQESLERHRRELVWAERQRRYSISEEISAAEKLNKQAMHELRELGLALLDKDTGRIGFPTRINGREAVFSWQPGEENVLFWNYQEEDLRRPIPTDWAAGTPIRARGTKRHE